MRRPGAGPLDHCVYTSVAALEHGLDRAVWAVRDPARDAVAPRLIGTGGSEEHALYEAPDDDSTALHVLADRVSEFPDRVGHRSGEGPARGGVILIDQPAELLDHPAGASGAVATIGPALT